MPKQPKAAVLAEQNNELTARLRKMEDELQKATDRTRKLEKYKKAYKKTKEDEAEARRETIPRPAGECGRHWKLRSEMQLDDNKAQYLEIMRGIRILIAQARLDPRKRINQQDSARLGQINTAARKEWPYLNRFEGAWPVREFIKNSLRNRRYRILHDSSAPTLHQEDENEDPNGEEQLPSDSEAEN